MIQALRENFRKNLTGIFPAAEIDSFFYRLIEFRSGLSRLDIAMNPEKVLSDELINELKSDLQRLQAQEPIQYIIGATDFFGLKFEVNPSVLIPRPETEELVDWILQDAESQPELMVLDIGTGSGCIAISLSANLKNAEVSAWDISQKALETARHNASLNEAKVRFELKNVLENQELPQKTDIIVSNPPYVRKLEKDQMQANVLNYEPHLALFVEDDDALIFYRKILELAQNNLTKNGKLYFEINEFLKEELIALMKDFPVKNYEFRKDIYGKDRMLKVEF